MKSNAFKLMLVVSTVLVSILVLQTFVSAQENLVEENNQNDSIANTIIDEGSDSELAPMTILPDLTGQIAMIWRNSVGQLGIVMTVRNVGPVGSEPFDVVFYTNRDGSMNVMREIGRQRFTIGLPANFSWSVDKTFSISGFRDFDYIWAVIDDGQEVIESNEDNNWFRGTLPPLKSKL